MSDDRDMMPVHVTGYSEPPFITAMETAMNMCAEEGWTVETVLIHKLTPTGMSMWRLGARGDCADGDDE